MKYLRIGNRYVHRIIMENHIGRKITRNEVVHHINGDRFDNRIENLKLMTNSEHMSLHHKQGDCHVLTLEEKTIGQSNGGKIGGVVTAKDRAKPVMIIDAKNKIDLMIVKSHDMAARVCGIHRTMVILVTQGKKYTANKKRFSFRNIIEGNHP